MFSNSGSVRYFIRIFVLEGCASTAPVGCGNALALPLVTADSLLATFALLLLSMDILLSNIAFDFLSVNGRDGRCTANERISFLVVGVFIGAFIGVPAMIRENGTVHEGTDER